VELRDASALDSASETSVKTAGAVAEADKEDADGVDAVSAADMPGKTKGLAAMAESDLKAEVTSVSQHHQFAALESNAIATHAASTTPTEPSTAMAAPSTPVA